MIRFVPPAPVKVKQGKEVVHVREWNIEKLVDFIQEGLEMAVAEQLPEQDLELQILVSTQPEIRFNGWKPENAGELRNTIGEMIGAVLENIEVDEYLSE
ncbi:hypothetical protein MF271_21930 (plasmid) [Deinococcus sp. KNUC1210]|uniref:hypothetical protein n=1 Tax=Deinococcus sp. KNUC1210 TaxID=2917691 RepID=UPI001EEFB647|nr:hypothetical protein [Deinococcus sp. KNUC1210]ULH18139.1 hypothetical protein MF271_21930 [Deinococcus sp. KNUC1210]